MFFYTGQTRNSKSENFFFCSLLSKEKMLKRSERRNSSQDMIGFKFRGKAPIRIWFMDGSAKTLLVDESTNAEDVVATLVQKMKLKDPCIQYWSLFLVKEREQLFNSFGRPISQLEIPLLLCQRENSIRIVYRCRLFLDSVKHSTSLGIVHLLFVQAENDIISGNYPCSIVDSVYLASLAMISNFGAFDPELHKTGFLSRTLDRYIPAPLLQQRSMDVWEDEILLQYRRNTSKGITTDDAKLVYLQKVQQFPYYGCTFFLVQPKESSQLPQHVFLAVNADGIQILSLHEKEELMSPFQFCDLSRWWHTGETQFYFQVQNFDQTNTTISFTTLPGEAKEIVSLMTDYAISIVQEQGVEGSGVMLMQSGGSHFYQSPDSSESRQPKSFTPQNQSIPKPILADLREKEVVHAEEKVEEDSTPISMMQGLTVERIITHPKLLELFTQFVVNEFGSHFIYALMDIEDYRRQKSTMSKAEAIEACTNIWRKYMDSESAHKITFTEELIALTRAELFGATPKPVEFSEARREILDLLDKGILPPFLEQVCRQTQEECAVELTTEANRQETITPILNGHASVDDASIVSAGYGSLTVLSMADARQLCDEGKYTLARDVLRDTYALLDESGVTLPLPLIETLQILHSYVIAKFHIHSEGDIAARLLTRVCNSDVFPSLFYKHYFTIILTTVAQCRRSGMPLTAHQLACRSTDPSREAMTMLFQNAQEDLESHPQLVKLREIASEIEPRMLEESSPSMAPCPHCGVDIPEFCCHCSRCAGRIPFCVYSGKHMVVSDWRQLGCCGFFALGRESILGVACPMCGMDVMQLIPISKQSIRSMLQVLPWKPSTSETQDGKMSEDQEYAPVDLLDGVDSASEILSPHESNEEKNSNDQSVWTMLTSLTKR